MSSGSVSSLANAEMNGHGWEEPVSSTPSRSQTSPVTTLYRDPGVPAVLVHPSVSPAAFRPNSGKIKANLKGVKKVFARGPNQISDDGLDYGEGSAGRRKRLPSFNILRIPRRPRYRLRILGRRRRSRPIPYDDSAIDGHVYEEDGINSDPEGMMDEFVEVSEEDSGEGGLSDSQQRGDLEERFRHADMMVRRLEEEKSKDDHSPDVASPDTDDKQGSRSWTLLHLASRPAKRTSLEQWRKKRDQLSSQLKSHSTHPQHRFMSNTRRHLGSGFVKISKGLRRLRTDRRRPKSANGEEDDVGGMGVASASVEDIHQTSSVADYELEEEDEDIESLRENLSTLQQLYKQRSKELEDTALKHESGMADLRCQVETLARALEGEKEKADNLQVSFMEVMVLKQTEVNNLQQQLASVEKQTFDRHQFLEEQLDECNSKIGQLEQYIHRQPGPELKVPDSSPLIRRLIIAIISFVLLVATTVLAFTGYVTAGGRWAWQKVFRGSRFLAVLSIVLAPVASYLLYYAVHSTTDHG